MNVISSLGIEEEITEEVGGDIANMTKLSKMSDAIAYMITNYSGLGEGTDAMSKTIGDLRDNLTSLVESLNEKAGKLYELYMLDNDLTSYLDIVNVEEVKDNISLEAFD